MRAGGSCSLQQALTPEAAALVKQAVTLAKRRGHGQVTPLHVAVTMLTASTGLLRAACLRSNSHPLQCKALELCFNVALNRLPAASSGPMFGFHGVGNSHHHHHHHHVPSISNALIAAFKRAQALQRRGSIETNQSLLAVKIELDRLVISILDDPSVSRVMREAGFSSSQVKINVDRVVISSETPSPSSPSPVHNTLDIVDSMDMNLSNIECHAPHLPSSSKAGSKQDRLNPLSRDIDDDVIHVMENLMEKRRRSIVIVGECTDTIESVVRGLTDKLMNYGSLPDDDVAWTFKGVKLIDLSLSSFEHLPQEGVEQKLGELRAHLRSKYIHMMMSNDSTNGVILFLGDLRWVVENRANSGVEHLVVQLQKLIGGLGEDERVWVMGMATLHCYMRCKTGYPSLESVWRLHPVAVPVGSLSLSLIADSDAEIGRFSIKKCESGSFTSSWLLPLGVPNHRQSDDHLTCCVDCSSEFEKEARSLQNASVKGSPNRSTSSLPPWLQQYKDEQTGVVTHRDDDRDYAKDLRRKWYTICKSIHGQSQSSERSLKPSSLLPSPSSSGFSYEPSVPNMNPADQTRADYNSWIADQPETVSYDPNPSRRNSPWNSGSSSDDIMEIEYFQRFKELKEKNMRLLVEKLEEKVPWQKHVIPEIAATVLRCRSGTIKRKGSIGNEDHNEVKNETWFLFQGTERDSKEKIASELATLVFGSYHSLISILLSSQSSDRDKSCSGFEEFAEAVSDNPHRVFFIDEIAELDRDSREHFKKAIESGKLSKPSCEEVDLKDAIVILSHGGSSRLRSAMGHPIKLKPEEDEEEEINPSLSLDLNIAVDHTGAQHHHSDIDELAEYVDKLILFEVQEL